MKNFYSLIFLFVFFFRAFSQDTVVFKQEIQYVCEGANEVFLVWGVNNWNTPGKNNEPPGSFTEHGLLHTPMKKRSGTFSVRLNVPENTTIDYVFHITKGPLDKKVEIWDINKAPRKDFHTVVSGDNIAVVKSTVEVRPKEMISILDFAPTLLFPAALIFLIMAGCRFFLFKNSDSRPGGYAIIISVSVVLSAFLFFTRASVSGLGWDLYLNPAATSSKVFVLFYYDFLFVFSSAVFFSLLTFAVRGKPKISAAVNGIFLSCSLVTLVFSILNIRIIETLGKPFTWQWLYYSDFLQSADSRSALSANFSVNYLSSILLVTLSAFLFCIVLSYLFHLINEKLGRRKRLAVLPLLAVPVYFFITPSRLDQYNFKKEKLSNPVAAFLGSVNPFASRPSLFTMNVPDSLFLEFQNRNERKVQVIPGKIKNVLMIVLESTPAEYVSGYTTRYAITPNLEKYLAHSALFENVYAHAPATNNSMVSLLASVYPWLSHNSITREHPDISVPTLSSELKGFGYRTGFFNSADNRFQKAGEFLFNRRMDCINDCRNNQCGNFFEVEDEKKNFLNGKDDECTADELLHWIGNGDKKPFFAMMWTYQTHYPYFFSGKEKLYSSEDSVFNRYLNAVEHNDFVLGKILKTLDEKNLSASTLVIVVGDHGEAFGRHNQTTHASNIYEENVHVPCIFIHPEFNGERIKNCGGIIDIAPTVMNLLGHAPPAEWQGSDLFASDENRRVYFFTPWGDYQFGYRQQNLKYIFNATENATAVYDLKNDPEEKTDLSGKFSDEANKSHLHLAAWVQWHSSYLNKVLKKKERGHH